jgi:membrane protein implicated in regulation of membrane protease activity
MTGSTPALIITFVVVVVLAAWIVAEFYADAHPEWQRQAASRRGIAGRAADPAGHGRAQERSTASPRDHHPARMPLTPARR